MARPGADGFATLARINFRRWQMDSKNYTQVLIDGKIYTLGGSEDEGYLQRAASYVNEKVNTLRRIPGFTKQSVEYQTVMAELNMVDDYFKAMEHGQEVEHQRDELERETYSLKHELVSTQMKLEVVLKDLEERQRELEELTREKHRLERKLREATKNRGEQEAAAAALRVRDEKSEKSGSGRESGRTAQVKNHEKGDDDDEGAGHGAIGTAAKTDDFTGQVEVTTAAGAESDETDRWEIDSSQEEQTGEAGAFAEEAVDEDQETGLLQEERGLAEPDEDEMTEEAFELENTAQADAEASAAEDGEPDAGAGDVEASDEAETGNGLAAEAGNGPAAETGNGASAEAAATMDSTAFACTTAEAACEGQALEAAAADESSDPPPAKESQAELARKALKAAKAARRRKRR